MGEAREDTRNAHKTSVGKSEGNRPRGKTTHIWEGNITMDLEEVGWES
jgi:hypothetical protein